MFLGSSDFTVKPFRVKSHVWFQINNLKYNIFVETYMGTIIMFGGTFASREWAFCNGQLLPIASHTTLFSILGTTYRWDERTTFALPDLRVRVTVHSGQVPCTADNVRLGQKGGNDRHAISVQELAPHGYDLSALKGTLGANEEDVVSEDPQVKILV